MMKHSAWKSRALLVGAAVLAGVTLFPAGVTTAATPTGHYSNESSARAIQALADNGIHDPNLKVITVDNLSVMGHPARGYVNVFTKQDVIYIAPFTSDRFHSDRGSFNSIITHEYGHILQKHLINKDSSGAYDRYLKLLELNHDLTVGAPKVVAPIKPAFDGIETNADCILSLYNVVPQSTYIAPFDGCNLKGTAMADAVNAGEWPTASVVQHFETKVKEKTAAQAKKAEEAQSDNAGMDLGF